MSKHAESWEVRWSTFTQESDCPSLRSVEVEGPRGVVAKVYGRTSKEMEKRARTVAVAPELLQTCRDLLALVRLKYGNLSPEANKIQETAQGIIQKAGPAE